MSARRHPYHRIVPETAPRAVAGSASSEAAHTDFSATVPSTAAERAAIRAPLRPTSSRRMSWVLSRATKPMHVRARNFRFLVLPEQNRILSNAPDIDAMLGDLLHADACSTANVQSLNGDLDWNSYRSAGPLQELAWELALREAPLPRYAASEDHRVYRLSGWPVHVGLDRAQQRLASLFTRSAATIFHGSRIADVPRAQVVAFLCACEAIGIQVVCSGRGQASHDWPREPLVNGLQLRRLRRHLRHDAAEEHA